MSELKSDADSINQSIGESQKNQAKELFVEAPRSEPRRLRYYFDEVMACEMCGDSAENAKILGQRLNTSQGLHPNSKTGISVSVLKCTRCNLIYASPQPIPFDIQDHYGVPPESYWAGAYFDNTD